MSLNISFLAEPLFHIGNFVVTNTLLTSWVVVGLLCVFSLVLVKRLSLVPGKLQAVVEVFFEESLKIIEETLSDKKIARTITPFILAFFVYILFSNWLGILPGFGSIGLKVIEEGEEVIVPFFRSANSDLNFPLGLALISVLVIQFLGLKHLGVFDYLKKFFNFSHPINFMTGILELIGEFTKILSFSFRLFGNIFGGEVVLVIISFIFPFFAPAPFYLLELVVGLVQAFIFALLTTAFIKVAIAKSH